MSLLRRKRILNISIFLIFICGIYFTYYLTSSFAYNKGNKDGLKVGYRDGYQDTKSFIETALIGVPVLLADSKLEKSISYQKTIHNLELAKNTPLIRTIVSGFTDEFNYAILDRLINFSDFTIKEKDTIFSRYKRSRQLIADEVYNNYISYINSIDIDKRNLLTKAESLGKSLASPSCALLDLLSPLERHKIAKSLLKAGIKRKKKIFKKSVEVKVTDMGISFVSEQLCNLLVTNSVKFISATITDYARIINFTERELVGNHKLEKVMDLVTAKSSLDFIFEKSFERDWAVDPNYSVRVNSNVLAGIDLAKFYMVEFLPKEITESGFTETVITLPKPEILSVYPSIDPTSLNTVLATKLTDNEIRQLTRLASYKSKQMAINKGLLRDAKEGAEDALNTLYAPLFLNSLRDYRLKVNFVDKISNKDDTVFLKV
jgi:hypothetical protein